MTKFAKTASAALLLVTVLAFVFVTAPAHSAPATQDNLLKNPDFEGGFYAYQGDSGRSVPNNWEPWWDSAKSAPRYNASTEPSRIQSGGSAASYWDVFVDYDAGLRQKIEGVTPGTTFRFQAYGMAWSTTDPAVKTSDTDVFMQIGIDPTGNTNPFESSVVWSGGANPRDAYQLQAVEATAQGDTIVVFLRGKTTFPVSQTDMYWDNATLIATGSAPPPEEKTATPKPSSNNGGGNTVPQGSIPQSTPAPDGSVVHVVRTGETLIGVAVTYDVTLEEIRRLNNLTTDVIFVGQTLVIKTPSGGAPAEEEPEEVAEEEEPEEEEPVEEEPVEEEVVEEILPASICVMGYDDDNSNGLREAGEISLAGMTFVLSDGINTVATYTTDGVSEPYCFADLEPGAYIVSWVGDTLVPTNEQTWAASIDSGDTVSREFGATTQGSGEDEDEAGGGGGGIPPIAIAIGGALGVILLLGGIGAAVYFLVIRRSDALE